MLLDAQQVIASSSQLAQAFLDVPQTLVDEFRHMAARGLAVIADGENLADLPQCESRRLRLTDERDALDAGGRVVAVPAIGALGLVEQPLALVVAQRRRCDTGRGGKFPDEHAHAFRSVAAYLTLKCGRRFRFPPPRQGNRTCR